MIFGTIGGCDLLLLILSYVTLEKTRQLLRDHFERNDTVPMAAIIGTADELALSCSLI